MKKVYNIFKLLKLVQQRPGMYLLNKSLSNLINFKYGYQLGLKISGYEKYLLKDKYYDFQNYVILKTIGKDNTKNNCWIHSDCLLKVTNGDEEKAFDLFFKLLDEFIEKEGIEIEIL